MLKKLLIVITMNLSASKQTKNYVRKKQTIDYETNTFLEY